jgi:putative PEP-CTERM system histidine kinase
MSAGDKFWFVFGHWSFLAGAIACTLLALWLLGREQGISHRRAIIAATSLTALWSLIGACTTPVATPAFLFEAVRNIGWLVAVYFLFASDGRHSSLQPIRPVLITLGVIELLLPIIVMVSTRSDFTLPLKDSVFDLVVTLHLMVTVGALVLVHNLYVGADQAGRAILRWPIAALAAMWGYDLNFYTISYLGDRFPLELASMRGLITTAMVAPLAIGFSKQASQLKFKPSRTVAFQSLSLLVIGAYLLLMVGIALSISLIGGDVARLTQVGFVFAASVFALLWLPSEHMRRWLTVTAIKHLFQHRYDYRAEWLRFTSTIGLTGDDAPPLQERAVKVMADICDSPSGLLLLPGEKGRLVLAASWQWPLAEVPAEAMSAEAVEFFERENFVCSLDDLRNGREYRGEAAIVPGWLLEDGKAWTLVPLLHYERLTGLVILARPPVPRELDWEDFDLLRVVGQHIASYLAEQAGQEALHEASNFEEFNRRIAFVMHDIKNLASQLSLLARNAERHADNPEFQADMLVTLRNSADKLNALLARLGRYGKQATEALEPVILDACVAEVVRRLGVNNPVMLVEIQRCTVAAHREGLEQALVHVIQNAIDASPPDTPVFLRVRKDGLDGIVEIVDSGCGMSPEFVRTRLFKPFVSSKADGFGIGAFEARELIHGMKGVLDVESREGLGTRFFIRLPLAEMTDLISKFDTGKAEVA